MKEREEDRERKSKRGKEGKLKGRKLIHSTSVVRLFRPIRRMGVASLIIDSVSVDSEQDKWDVIQGVFVYFNIFTDILF